MAALDLSTRRATLLLAAILMLAALLRVWGLWFGLPYIRARPDEIEAVSHAVSVFRGDPNPHFFHWPSLQFYLLAALYTLIVPLYRLAGTAADSLTFAHWVIPARAFVALAGIVTVVVLYRLAAEVAGRRVALAAALFLAVSPLHARDSHFAMTDVTMALFVTITLWLVVVASRRLDTTGVDAACLKAFALAGIAGGLAAGTKYNAAIVLAAAGCAQMWHLARVRAWWRPAVFAPLAVFTACLGATFLVTTPYAILDVAHFRADILFDAAHLSAGHDADLGRGWLYHFTFSLPAGLGVPIFVAGLAGLAAAVRYPLRPVSLIAAFGAVYYASIGSGHTVFARYIMPLLPVLCLFAALGVDSVARWASGRIGAKRDLTLGLAVLVAAAPLAGTARLVTLLPRTDTRVLAARWLASRLATDATIFETGREYVRLDLETPRLHRWTFNPSTGHFTGATPDMLPEWLVVHESPLGVYTPVPPPVARLARERYRLVQTFPATSSDTRPEDYDQQDAFFLPLRHLSPVLRPGPSISVYLRR